MLFTIQRLPLFYISVSFQFQVNLTFITAKNAYELQKIFQKCLSQTQKDISSCIRKIYSIWDSFVVYCIRNFDLRDQVMLWLVIILLGIISLSLQ